MRILTNSPKSSKGLIKVVEADEYSPQHVIFCIPIEENEAKNIQDINDFRQVFSRGIVTKVKRGSKVNTIALDLHKNLFLESNISDEAPIFIAKVDGYEIDFHLSPLNYKDYKIDNKLSIDFFYEGMLASDLSSKRFVILEPDWNLLDIIFLTKKISFADWDE